MLKNFDKKSVINLFFVVIFGFVLRVSYIDYVPSSLNWDEVSHGVNAYSILKTGTDQWGQKFPLLNFRAYGDYPTTLNLYLTIPFLIIFGLTEFAIRFPHVLIGTFTILSVYFLMFGISKRKDMSLFSAFLVAVTPWYLFTSRFVLQSNLSVFFLITSVSFFVNREKSKFFLPFTFFLLTLTLFSYHTTRIFSPLFLIGALSIYRKEIKNKLIYLFSVLFILISILILLNPIARERSKYLGIIDQGAINKIETNQNKYGRIISNKATYFIYKFGSNYISYFSPKFLFIDGGTQYQFSLPNHGLLYLITLPFFYLGLFLLIKKSLPAGRQDLIDKNYQMLLLWLILAPIPASLTNESYAVLRATTMLPIPEILISLGLFSIANWLNENSLKNEKWKLIIPAVAILILLSLKGYLTEYFTTYRTNYSWSWQYGYKEAVNYVSDNYSKYDKIIVTKKYGEPHEYFLFYLKYDPQKYLNDTGKIAFQQSNWWWVDRFDKFYFVNDWQIRSESGILKLESGGSVDCVDVKCLLITSPDNFPKGFTKLDTINFLDGKPAFEIYEN